MSDLTDLIKAAPKLGYEDFFKWETGFLKEYPHPPKLPGRDELTLANYAVMKARWAYVVPGNQPFDEQTVRRLAREFVDRPTRAWINWRRECWEKYKRDEWPVIWAAKALNTLRNLTGDHQ